jgi:hypothetical protein
LAIAADCYCFCDGAEGRHTTDKGSPLASIGGMPRSGLVCPVLAKLCGVRAVCRCLCTGAALQPAVAPLRGVQACQNHSTVTVQTCDVNIPAGVGACRHASAAASARQPQQPGDCKTGGQLLLLQISGCPQATLGAALQQNLEAFQVLLQAIVQPCARSPCMSHQQCKHWHAFNNPMLCTQHTAVMLAIRLTIRYHTVRRRTVCDALHLAVCQSLTCVGSLYQHSQTD